MDFRLLALPIPAVCICISATLAFLFGHSQAENAAMAVLFGLVCGSGDLLKSVAPILASRYVAAGDRAKGRGAWAVFAVFTVLSLWAAFGNLAGAAADRHAIKATDTDKGQQARATLERLRRDRESIGNFDVVTASSVEIAKQAAATASQEALAENATGCLKRCREAQERARKATAALLLAEGNAAKTARAAELDAKIAEAEQAVRSATTVRAAREADPQSAVLADATGLSSELFGLINHILLALAIEIGSGIGLWLTLGHSETKREEPEAEAPARQDEPPPVVTEDDIRDRFFAECTGRDAGGRVKASAMFDAYAAQCRAWGVPPMDRIRFGRNSRWQKQRIGGTVYYVGMRLLVDVASEATETRRARKQAKPSLRLVAANALPA